MSTETETGWRWRMKTCWRSEAALKDQGPVSPSSPSVQFRSPASPRPFGLSLQLPIVQPGPTPTKLSAPKHSRSGQAGNSFNALLVVRREQTEDKDIPEEAGKTSTLGWSTIIPQFVPGWIILYKYMLDQARLYIICFYILKPTLNATL